MSQILLVASAVLIVGLLVLFWLRKSPWVLPLTAAATIGFAFAGLLSHARPDDPLGVTGTLTNALFGSVKGLFLDWDPRPSDGLSMRIAMLAALATMVMLAYEALTRLFAESIQRWLLARATGHVVVCGLGRIGYDLVRDLRAPTPTAGAGLPPRRRVVVVEPNRENDYLAQVQELGAAVVYGDATDATVLRRVSAHRASDVFFVTGDDEANVEAACKLTDVLAAEANASDADPPSVYVHLLHADLGTVVENRLKLRGRTSPLSTVKAFNVLDRSVQHVIGDLILPWRPRRQDEVAHFVMVGFGEVGQRLCLGLAEQAHFENLRRVRMTVVYDEDEQHAVKRFREIYPALTPVAASGDPWNPDAARDDWAFGVSVADRQSPSAADCGIDFVVNGGWVNLDSAPRSDEFIARIVDLAHAPGVRPIVFVCKDGESQNCSLAQQLRTELDGRLKVRARGADAEPVYCDGVNPVPIFTYVPGRPALTRLIDCPDLISFGAGSKVCAYRELKRDLQRPLAMAFAEDYYRKQQEKAGFADGRAPRSTVTLPDFETLPAWERHSNFSAAAHVNVKLAVLGLRVELAGNVDGSSTWTDVSDSERETIARMEHNRWLAERLLSGWTFGPRSDSRKQRFSLVDWGNLSADEWVKDCDQVDRILRFCRESAEIRVVPACQAGDSPTD